MKRRRHTPEQLREADWLLAEGHDVTEVVKQLKVSEATYHHWRAHLQGLPVSSHRIVADHGSLEPVARPCIIVARMDVSEGNPFAALSDYQVRNLIAHLDAAGRVDLVHRVFARSTDSGRNGWYEAHLALGDSTTFAGDVARAWNLAEAASASTAAADEPCAELGLQVRYALVTATLNSQAQNVPTALVVAALERRVWSRQRAFALVRQLQAPAGRAAALAAIAPHIGQPLREAVLSELVASMSEAAPASTLEVTLFADLPDDLPEHVLRSAVAVARQLGLPRDTVSALRWLSDRLPEPARLDVLHEALQVARAAPPGAERLGLLASLVGELPEAVPDALSTLRTLDATSADERGARDRALLALSPHLSDDELALALKAVARLESREGRLAAIAELAPHLTEPLLEQAIERASSARSKLERACTLAVLASAMPDETRDALHDEALAVAGSMQTHQGRARTLAAIVPSLPKSKRDAVVDKALAAPPRDENETGPVLIELMAYASEQQLQTVLDATVALAPHTKLEVLDAAWPRVPAQRRGALIQSALTAARAEDRPLFRVEALAAILPRLSMSARERVAREAFELARTLESGYFREQGMAALAPQLPTELLAEAIDAAEAIDDRAPASLLLLTLAPHLGAPLEEDVTDAALELALGWPNYSERVPVVEALAPFLTAPQLRRALEAMKPANPNDYGQTLAQLETLPALGPRLPKELLPEALTHAEAISGFEERAYALAALAPFCSPVLLRDALAAARAIPPGYGTDDQRPTGPLYSVVALVGVGRSLPEHERVDVCTEALALVRELRWPRDRAELLTAVLADLPPELRPEATAAALAAVLEGDMPEAATVVLSLAPHVTDAQRPRALKVARSLRDDEARAIALTALGSGQDAPHRAATPLRRRASSRTGRAGCRCLSSWRRPPTSPNALASCRSIRACADARLLVGLRRPGRRPPGTAPPTRGPLAPPRAGAREGPRAVGR